MVLNWLQNETNLKALPSITIKNIPEQLYKKIKEKAEAQRRSINSEIIYSLEQSVNADRVSEDEILYEARKFRKNIPKILSNDEISAAIKEGRE